MLFRSSHHGDKLTIPINIRSEVIEATLTSLEKQLAEKDPSDDSIDFAIRMDVVYEQLIALAKAKGELYIGCAEYDELAPLAMVAELKKLFDASGNGGELEMYPNVHHGFAFPQRKIYDKQAAERHWERLIALYRRRLG